MAQGLDLTIDEVKYLQEELEKNRDQEQAWLDKEDDEIDLQQLLGVVGDVKPVVPVDTQLAGQIEALATENQRLKMMVGQDSGMADRRVERLRSDIEDGENVIRTLKQKNQKLEAQKSRLEDLFKASMKGGTQDLID